MCHNRFHAYIRQRCTRQRGRCQRATGIFWQWRYRYSANIVLNTDIEKYLAIPMYTGCPNSTGPHINGVNDDVYAFCTHSISADASSCTFVVYDPHDSTTLQLLPMPHCRANYGMTLVNNGASLNRNNNRNGDVLVCGGSYDAFGFLSTCVLYLSNFNVWLQLPSLPKTMKWFPMVTLQGGRVVDDNKRQPHSRRA
jgi:hypothetical protein